MFGFQTVLQPEGRRVAGHAGDAATAETTGQASGLSGTSPCPRAIWLSTNLRDRHDVSLSWLARSGRWVVLGLVLLAGGWPLCAAPERFDVFDVFIGYDGIVPQASWFPVVCEIENKGPGFNAVFEVNGPQSEARQMPIELPTGTRKRFVVPMFSASRYRSGGWSARLLDERGRLRAEPIVRPVRRVFPSPIPLLGAVLRTAEGRPLFPNVKTPNADLKLDAARLLPELFPDNPIALEGLDVIYLNSEQAMEDRLKVNQVNALLAWLHGGGHLIVGVEQISHVNGTAWLRRLFPCELSGMTTAPQHAELQQWLRSDQRIDGRTYVFEMNAPTAPPGLRAGRQSGRSSSSPTTFPNPFADLAEDAEFEQAPLEVATGTLRDGRVLIGPANQPLVITARRGWGQMTVLLFSPERRPFVDWQHRAYFWAKLANVPAEVLAPNPQYRYLPYSVDGVFGSMVDSRQVRKLPVGWLLLLLLGYLAVIGPLDRWWLKKINRQMLTWLTFPAYVAFFSLLIYYIGYKLRAGESEWNELHVVDVIPTPSGETAELRGRTFASVYSPANARYPLESELPFAALRGEYLGQYGGGQEAGRASIQQRGNNFVARVYVPVWTSQLYVNDWWNRDEPPLEASVRRVGENWEVTVENHLGKKLAPARLVVGDRVHDLGELRAGERKTFNLAGAGAGTTSLQSFVQSHSDRFQQAVQMRQRAFGENREVIRDLPASVMATSFLIQRQDGNQYTGFQTPPRYDLTPQIEQGDAVLLAWAADYAPVKPFHKFNPRRSHRDTLFRLVCPVP